MSTRWYPFYQAGNPQLRIFLPNFWLKLVTPEHKQPSNVVTFHCSMEMTMFDVKNYLEKIYDVHPIKVNTRIALGKTYMPRKYVCKEDDIKIAYVTLPKGQTFTFPTLFPPEKDKDEQGEKQMDQIQKEFKEFSKNNKIPGVPSWFAV
ncbi:mitochondrial ribosomal protein L23 [Osmia lignaria lignaria]|uniref:39S ribosomal protein L23, mitochondrial n=1 Tax=Osmia lignaria TaxID=473952 RepID=UPI001478735C|nr:39S ribosomal protein L23, mitochondrial [Osmia lignaria]XP_034181017.1 39S ribosomal protein L23, mitochondrial [Osmia lignaria]